MAEGPKVSVITPAYREGRHIYRSLGVLEDELATLDRTYEIILVSDGSDDDTVSEATRRSDVRVLEYPTQRGKGYALRHGLEHAEGEVVVFIDSDMELHPSGIRALVELVEAGADAAIGSKRHPASQVQYPPFRRLQSAVYQRIVRALFSLDVTDTQTGLKAFRADMLRRVALPLSSNGYAFDLELLVALNDAGARIEEGPVTLDYAFETTTGAGAVVDVLRDTYRIWRRRTRR